MGLLRLMVQLRDEGMEFHLVQGKGQKKDLKKKVLTGLLTLMVQLKVLLNPLLTLLMDDQRELRWVYQMGPMMVFARETLMSFLTLMDVLRVSPRVSVKVELMVFLKLLFQQMG